MIRALLVGVSYTNTPYTLKGCLPDINRISAYLHSAGITAVTVLRDDIYTAGDDNYPSRKNFLRELAGLIRKAGATDKLYVHFSGHGFFIKSVGGLANGNQKISEETNECLLMHSNSTPSIHSIGVSNTVCDTQVTQLLTLLPPTARLMMTVDACAAGNMFDLPFNLQVTNQTSGRSTNEAQFTLRGGEGGKRDDVKNVVIFTSVREHKYAWDVKVDGETYGIFTKTLIDILEASRQQKKPLSYLDLLFNLDKHLRNRAKQQDPQLSVGSRKDVHGNVFI